MRLRCGVAVVFGFLVGVLLAAPPTGASADHPTTVGGGKTLYSEFLPGVGGSVRYSLCSWDPDGLPRNNDGDEYVPDEYQTALNGWKVYLLAFTPMQISWEQMAGDCDSEADLRVAVQQSSTCELACEVSIITDVGAYQKIQTADVYVQDGWFENMGQWKQTIIHHEVGHALGLGDHATTQCNYITTASGFQAFIVMQQYDPEGGVLNPCAPEPTVYDALGIACTAYSYDCADVNTFYTLVFGPSPLFRDNTLVYVWLLAELGNTYGDEEAIVSVSMTPGVPGGCSESGWVRLLPGPTRSLFFQVNTASLSSANPCAAGHRRHPGSIPRLLRFALTRPTTLTGCHSTIARRRHAAWSSSTESALTHLRCCASYRIDVSLPWP